MFWDIKIGDLITIVALLVGPILAVWVTLWSQKRRERRSAKLKLFLDVLGERKKIVTPPIAAALNTIDIVFYDSRQVKTLWNEYYILLHGPPSEARTHKWLELLQAMALDLGYPEMSQVALDRYYIPQGHVDEREIQQSLQQNFLRVLKATEHMGSPRDEDEPDE